MKALIQRVKHAKVQVGNKDISSINEGLLIFLGIHKEDTFDETDYIVNKILNLRLFPKNKSESGFDISIIDSLGLFSSSHFPQLRYKCCCSKISLSSFLLDTSELLESLLDVYR